MPKQPVPAAASPAPATGGHLFLVDGSSYIFRAYHALPPLNRKSDGLQINAVLGFCNMLWKLLRDMPADDRPTHLAVVFDKSEVTFRNELYPQYKAHRPPAPDDLIPQFALIREAVHAFELPCLEQTGFEADDLIATYARQASARGARTTIVASDKDLMQLVSERVELYDTMKDRRLGVPEVIEKFGVPPDKVVEVQALAGDSVDNVPGVPGIGIKTAAQLITDYGDLDTLLSRAAEIKQPKRREALIAHAEQARLSRKLVLLDDNVALDVPLDELAVHEPDARRLIAFLKAMEFTTLTRRVAEYSQIDPSDVAPDERLKSAVAPAAPAADSPQTLPLGGGAPAPLMPAAAATAAPPAPRLTPQALAAARATAAAARPVDRDRYDIVRTLEHLARWIARAHDTGVVALHVAASGPDAMQADICGIALAVAPNEAAYLPLGHRQGGESAGLFGDGLAADQIEAGAALEALKPLIENEGVLKIGHNLKTDALVLARHGIALNAADDILLMAYVLDAGRASHDIAALAESLLGHTTIPYGEVAGTGKAQVGFDRVAIDKAAPYAAERPRCGAAVVAGREGPPRRRAHDDGVTKHWSARWSGCCRHGTARHRHRPPDSARLSGEFAQTARASRPRSRSSPASRSIPAARSSLATSCSAR